MTSKILNLKTAALIVCLLTSFNASASFETRNYNLLAATASEFSCNSYTQDCWAQANDFLDKHKVQKLPTEDDHLNVQGTLVRTVGQRSRLVILAVHGLFDNSTQFNTELQQALNMGINSVSITLPGHGPLAGGYNKVKYYDWQKAARDGLNLALALGDQVVVLGQSTGALVLYDLLLENPQQKIIASILIEPSLLLHAILAEVTCDFKSIIKTAQQVPELAKFFGYDDITTTEQPISLNLGCQTARLQKSLLDRHLQSSPAAVTSSVHPSFIQSKYQNLLSHKIPPSLIGHTSADNIVVDTVTQLLIQIQGPRVVSYDETKILGRDVDHGSDTQLELTRWQDPKSTSYDNNKLGAFLLATFPSLKDDFDQAWAESHARP